jgi:hypothetical protein
MMGFVTPKKEGDVFLKWQRERRWTIRVLLLSPLLFFTVVLLAFFETSQAQVPVVQGPEVLVLVTQVQERQVPEMQVLEIEVSETQLLEIQPEILEIRMPVTQWLSRQGPETHVLKPETRLLEIKVPVTQWLKRRIPEMQWLEIQVPVALLQERQVPETQVLGIQVTVAQLQEIQGTEALVLVAQVPEAEILFYGMVGICIVYSAVPIVIQQCVIKRSKRRLSRKACIFVALAAAKNLEEGNPVRASLSMDRLLLTLSDFLRQKLVPLGAIWVCPQDFMHVTPEKIPRRAVFQAIQDKEDTKDFQERLHNLEKGLRGKGDAGYLAAHKFLAWLDRKTKLYQEVYSKSFFERHPTLRTIIVYLGPPTVAALGGIAILVARILSQQGLLG